MKIFIVNSKKIQLSVNCKDEHIMSQIQKEKSEQSSSGNNRLISVDYYIYFFLYHKIIKDSNDWWRCSCCSCLMVVLMNSYNVKISNDDEEVIEDTLLWRGKAQAMIFCFRLLWNRPWLNIHTQNQWIEFRRIFCEDSLLYLNV